MLDLKLESCEKADAQSIRNLIIVFPLRVRTLSDSTYWQCLKVNSDRRKVMLIYKHVSMDVKAIKPAELVWYFGARGASEIHTCIGTSMDVAFSQLSAECTPNISFSISYP
jgi:hypothetical protein